MSGQGLISDSAFLVNESRARNVSLSRDRYAHLWVSERTRRLWEDFTREVYPYDELELGLRNRFFLTQLETSARAGQVQVFINFAAGFTSYPYLIDAPLSCFEIDLEHVIRYKRRRIEKWQAEGLLPRRDVTYLEFDLTEPEALTRLRRELTPRLRGRASFLMTEGLVYYLEPPVLARLWSLFAELQTEGSFYALDFWSPLIARHPVLLRFGTFCRERFGYQRDHYTFLMPDDVGRIAGYRLAVLTDIQKLEKQVLQTEILADYERILPENYAVLQRTG
jgi:O-methyltransferase involved in polyketide biosynthesis